MNLKKTLKTIKLNESSISMILGLVIVVVIGVLIVNFVRNQKTGSTLPTGEITEQQPNDNTGPTVYKDGKTIHIVQKGDNLWKVAERYFKSGYNWVDIAKENSIKNVSLIEAGQELIIPSVEAKQITVKENPQQLASTSQEEQAITSTNLSNDSTPISGATYTVVKGDSLWKISVRAYGDGYKWVGISKENHLLNPGIIHPGNVLTLPR